jgi:hypothetical protein
MSIQPTVLTDARGNIANVTLASQLTVGNGFVTAVVTLNAVTTNATGTTVDAGIAQSNWSAVAVATGTPTAGVLTLQLSLDGVNWVSSGATNSIPAAGTYGMFSTGSAARYGRVTLTGLAGSVVLTVNMMAAG